MILLNAADFSEAVKLDMNKASFQAFLTSPNLSNFEDVKTLKEVKPARKIRS